ncbi:hypothetical protein [Streptomyces coelicoflavus]|uniref:hypothetical protein n=1 Tax=Streptomyces coelicoflavus TaxID=285562 RepID=UPI00194075D7|nr:hypothetical protein [Streptomyces coelicoflavus]
MGNYQRADVERVLPYLFDDEPTYGVKAEVYVEDGMPKGYSDPSRGNSVFASLADVRRAWQQADLSLVERQAVFMRYVLDDELQVIAGLHDTKSVDRDAAARTRRREADGLAERRAVRGRLRLLTGAGSPVTSEDWGGRSGPPPRWAQVCESDKEFQPREHHHRRPVRPDRQDRVRPHVLPDPGRWLEGAVA